MKHKLSKISFAVACTSLIALNGCGGGGSGGNPTAASSASFSGVAAVGAPVSGATITVVDAAGTRVATAITLDDGSYAVTFDPSKSIAPFVIVADGKVGDAAITLVSVQAKAETAVVNVTPITNAIAAQLSSTGNPLDLAANMATEKANLTDTKISAMEQGFRAALAPNMTAVGLAATTGLIGTRFDAKLDKLLDNVHVEVSQSGGVSMVSSKGGAIDDDIQVGTPPAATVLILAKGVVPSSSDASSLPASTAPVGIDILETGRIALNNCFAVPSTSRPTAAACSGIASNTYLNDGRNGSMEFDGLTNDAGNDGMQFRKPEILRQISDTPGAEKILVRLSALRKDGFNRELITVAGNSSAGWQLVGNNRQYESNVSGVASKRISANTPANNRYETGLNLIVRDDYTNTIASVLVTGPGLPGAGITLLPKAACGGYFTISDGTANPTCATFYRLRSQKTDGTTFTPTLNTHLYNSAATESTVSAIKPLDLYKFVLTKTAGGTVTYWNRLRSRPYTAAEIATVRFSDFTAATVALMTTGSTFYTGGAAPTVSWTTPEFGPRPGRAAFLHDTGSDEQRFLLGTTSTVIRCTSNPGCNNGGAGPDYLSPVTNASAYLFQTYARNRFDTLIFSGVSK